MQDIKIVATPNAPGAIGPYSQAVVHAGLVYCSGQVAFLPATGEFVEGGVEAQTTQVFKNLKAVLAEAGSSLGRALKLTVYVKDMNDFAAINQVYAAHFEGLPNPARATVEVARLPKDALVEIDCVAAVG
jgi:2-iminobutanoate/2-iminopropanoate deaminase